MKKDNALHFKHWKGCIKRKSPKNKTRVPLNPVESNAPLEIAGTDFVGPLPLTEDGNRYIMTFHDHFTRWPVAFPLKKATEIEVVDCIHSFLRDFGLPYLAYPVTAAVVGAPIVDVLYAMLLHGPTLPLLVPPFRAPSILGCS